MSLKVRHLRQALLWPLRLMPIAGDPAARRSPWQVLRDLGAASPWRELFDEYTGDRNDFHERHYNEFVSFLPYVQRFLYGEGRASAEKDSGAGSPMRVFRRRDIAALRVVPAAGDGPVRLDCEGGFGASVAVTGTFGFVAAAQVLKHLAKSR